MHLTTCAQSRCAMGDSPGQSEPNPEPEEAQDQVRPVARVGWIDTSGKCVNY